MLYKSMVRKIKETRTQNCIKIDNLRPNVEGLGLVGRLRSEHHLWDMQWNTGTILLQSITLRLQKERDSSAQEVVNLQEKMELLQSQMAKATRDRELLLSETETSRERYDKLNQSLSKLQVHQVVVDIFSRPPAPLRPPLAHTPCIFGDP